MALEAGELTLLLEYGSELKDVEWFGRQDPFCTITVGSQTYRSKTATDGGRNPVFNETFKFNVINENDFTITVKDKDVMSSDEYIGTGRGQLAKVRTYGQDKQQVPMMSKKGKQHGFIQVSLTFIRNSSIGAPGHGAPMPYGAPQYGTPMPYGAPQYGAPPPYGYGAPPPAYGAPGSFGGPSPGSYGYGAPPPGQYGTPPPGQYGAPPPGQYGAPPPGQYGAPPPGQYPPQQGYPPQQHGAPPPGQYPSQGYPPAGGHGGQGH